MTAKSQYSVPGIYRITNKISGQSYIGGTNNCQKRWTRHIWALKGGFHKLTNLQNDWNNLGSDNFEFIIAFPLPKLPKTEFKILKTIEETKILQQTPNNYNKTIGAGDFGFKLSKETKKKLSIFNKKKWKNKEYKKRLSEIHKRKWANGEYNKITSTETRKKQSIAKKKYYAKTNGMLPEHRANISKAHQRRKLATEAGNDPASPGSKPGILPLDDSVG